MTPRWHRVLLIAATAAILSTAAQFFASASAQADDWLAGAAQYGNNQDWQGLASYGQRWTQAQPQNPDAWATLGDAYCRLNQMDPSENAFKKSAALSPGDSRPWEALAGCYANQNQFDKSVQYSQTATEVAPNNGRAWLGLATQLHNIATEQQMQAHTLIGGALPPQTKKNFEDSAEAYKRAIQLNAGDPTELWTDVGSAYYYALDYIPAMNAYMVALRINPNYSYALNGLALCNGTMKTSCTNIHVDKNPGVDVVTKRWTCDGPTTALIHQADSFVAAGGN
jgi:tetratricopeptide (TPR) repeat protein